MKLQGKFTAATGSGSGIGRTIAVGDRPAPSTALRRPDVAAVRQAAERLGGPSPT